MKLTVMIIGAKGVAKKRSEMLTLPQTPMDSKPKPRGTVGEEEEEEKDKYLLVAL